MFALSMPNFATSSALVETATKCLATASSWCSAFSAHVRAVWALVIVSRVVKVFEEMIKSVSSGSRSRVASSTSVPSAFETKRKVMSRLL